MAGPARARSSPGRLAERVGGAAGGDALRAGAAGAAPSTRCVFVARSAPLHACCRRRLLQVLRRPARGVVTVAQLAGRAGASPPGRRRTATDDDRQQQDSEREQRRERCARRAARRAAAGAARAARARRRGGRRGGGAPARARAARLRAARRGWRPSRRRAMPRRRVGVERDGRRPRVRRARRAAPSRSAPLHRSARVCVAAARVELAARARPPAERRRDLGVELVERRRQLALLLQRELGQRRRLVGQAAGEELVGDDAERVEVGGGPASSPRACSGAR